MTRPRLAIDGRPEYCVTFVDRSMGGVRGTMRKVLTLILAVCPFVGLSTSADDPGEIADPLNVRFRESVRPFLEAYCLRCHGADKPRGDMDLSVFASVEAVAKDLPRWAL